MVEPLRFQFELRFDDREHRTGRGCAGGENIAVEAAQDLERGKERKRSHRDAEFTASTAATSACRDWLEEQVDGFARRLLFERLQARHRRLLLGLHPGDKTGRQESPAENGRPN